MAIGQRRAVASNAGIELTWFASDFSTRLKSWRSQPDGARQPKQERAIAKTRKWFVNATFKSLR